MGVALQQLKDRKERSLGRKQEDLKDKTKVKTKEESIKKKKELRCIKAILC